METIKVLRQTKKGTWIKTPVTIERRDGRVYFFKSPDCLETPFALKNEIKSMDGYRWHGFHEPGGGYMDGRKVWSVLDNTRNNFSLEFLTGGNPYANWDQPLVQYQYERPLRAHQELMANHCLTYHYKILAAEMGCISGDAIVHCNRAGKGFKITLAELFDKWSSRQDHGGKLGQKSWDASIPTFVRSMKDGLLGLNQLVNVLDKGVKPVIKITLKSGKTLTCTPDHEIYVDEETCVPSEQLVPGDTVLTNGDRGRIFFVPKPDIVEKIEPAGWDRVFDLVMADPYRNFVADDFIVHNCGKTLSAIEVLERSGTENWWWVAPKSGLNAVELEFDKWGLRFTPELMTYDRLRMIMKNWESGKPAPQGVIFDESSRLKGHTSKRTKAAKALADAIRHEHGWDGYVILMSGTPAPKKPTDWWSQCEICYPGFVKEGTFKAFEQRLRIFEKKTIDGSTFYSPIAWRDDEERCDICGQFKWVVNEDDEQGRWALDCDGSRLVHPNHNVDPIFGSEEAHDWVPSKNEVAYLHERLDGLVLTLKKKDCWDIPDKIYREIVLEPSTTIKRVAKALLSSATSAIQGITWLRELSDGFQYKEEVDPENPTKTCPVCKGEGSCEQWFYDGEPVAAPDNPSDYEKRMATCEICKGEGEVENLVRTTKEVRCPKEQAIRDLLEENEDQGRLVIFAGFRGSIDRIVNICNKQQWDVVRVDGRGWKVLKADGNHPTAKSVKPLHYWNDVDNNSRVVFVAHPESGGMGLTLTQSRMAVFYSNDFKPESRSQAEDRIHRPGIDENKGATIVDLFHLGSDRKVLNVLRDNRRLEQMTLGELKEIEL